ncbi:hypothetical protein JCM19236_633 [Vibrio sp. JCM 19236]|nr:hypothetical protein JCM19236_633 [Vibrio sp. JCM 19236]
MVSVEYLLSYLLSEWQIGDDYGTIIGGTWDRHAYKKKY